MATFAQVVVLPQGEASGGLPQLDVRELRLPDPAPTQVVVKQYASGICHSQLHQMHRGRRRPTLLGHESTGVVLRKGSAVTHVDEGDTVLVTWVPRDAANASAPPVAATLDVGGGEATSQNVFTWADHTIADEQFVVKATPEIARDVTAIIGCAVMTGAGAVLNTANVQAGDSVAIFGVGGVGLQRLLARECAAQTRSSRWTWTTPSWRSPSASARRTASTPRRRRAPQATPWRQSTPSPASPAKSPSPAGP